MLDVAVIGLSCVFPGAPDAESFWQNLATGKDAITEAPEDRIDAVFFSAYERAVDRIYCRRGGFLPAPLDIDAAGFGIMPRAAAGADPDQILALHVASQCLADAGYDARAFDRTRAGVVLGRGGYLTPGLARLDQKVRGAEQLVEALRTLVPHVSEEELLRIKQLFQERAGPFGPDTAIGLVPNLAASRISNRLDLLGPAYTIDGACASALLAVDTACREIASGRCEMLLAGGVHVTQDPTFWAVFSQLGALSRSGHIRPFDRRADGLLCGEGCGMLLLKDGRAAERDGDRIYARIRGVGVASDGRSASLFHPRVEGQVAAVARAWKEAERDPHLVDFLEAHGTGTPAGDAAEIETIGRVFGSADESERAPLGSVKSMIGHAMPAAGAAGLIKAVLAMHHGLVPPSLHCEEAHPALESTRFRVPSRSEPWHDRPSGVQLAGVSAFGFGGINAHVVLEATRAPRAVPRTRATLERADARVLAIAALNAQGILHALDLGIPRGGNGKCRLAMIDPTPERISRARRIVEKGEPWRGRHGIWFSPEALALGGGGQAPALRAGGRVLGMFPGIETAFAPSVEDVAAFIGVGPPGHTRPQGIEEQGRGVVELGLFWHRALAELGVMAHGFAGHSIGEWTGMIASGMVEEADAWDLIDGLGPGSLQVPGVLFAAAACDVARAEGPIGDLPEIAISHDNCPHQVILCGRRESIETARERLIAQGVLCQVLPFRSGFHSPLFEGYLTPHRRHFARLPLRAARIPLWSATTCRAYPSDPDAIRRLGVEHLVRPLRFRELVLALHEEGFRIFVQLGLGSLPGFVEDCLRGRPHTTVSASEPGRSGMAQLRNLALALFAEGIAVDLHRIAPATELADGVVRLDLGARLLRLPPDAVVATAARSAAMEGQAARSAVLQELDVNLEALQRSQEEVVSAFQEIVEKESWSAPMRLSVETVPALRDHSFFPQPEGWERMSDRYPVVPMTMTIDLLMKAARQVAPRRVAIGIERLEAMRWLMVEPEVEVELSARRLSAGEAEAEVKGYARARVLLSRSYPAPPAPDLRPLARPRPAPIEAAQLYADRYMFHGPRYQGVVAIREIGDDGVKGEIEARDAPGALLDNAGQLFGYWVMVTQARDRLAMPVELDKLELFGPMPPPGERVTCTVRVTRCEPVEVEADMEILRRGRVFARLSGWTDLRFASDEPMWNVMRRPEWNVLSVPRPGGYVLYDDGAQRAPSRDWLMRRYLGETERQEMQAAGPRRQRHFLNGRIAAKDAIRLSLWSKGAGPIYPVEIRFGYDDRGRPRVEGLQAWDVRTSIAHTGDVAVAVAAEGEEPGIDIERVEPRDPSFDEHAFSARERALLSECWPEGEARDEGRTRLWCAKEALAKARGTGLHGAPARIVVEGRDEDRFLVDGVWVATCREGPYVVAWTPARSRP